ncbi:hypothetical protein [Bacillus stercoris]
MNKKDSIIIDMMEKIIGVFYDVQMGYSISTYDINELHEDLRKLKESVKN